ncbi:unannotated protein [freshwater metagenome]|uniref:Unannotated protein n=1 Tax=freshwater metagenome TaxID=449393 RepID=A0A6J7JG69_9ZZZZ
MRDRVAQLAPPRVIFGETATTLHRHARVALLRERLSDDVRRVVERSIDIAPRLGTHPQHVARNVVEDRGRVGVKCDINGGERGQYIDVDLDELGGVFRHGTR